MFYHILLCFTSEILQAKLNENASAEKKLLFSFNEKVLLTK